MSNSVVSLDDRGKYLLVNWAAWVNTGASSRIGWGCSPIAGLMNNGDGCTGVPVDELKARSVERVLLHLRNSHCPDDKAMFEVARVEFLWCAGTKEAVEHLGISRSAFFAKRRELIMFVAGAVLMKKYVDSLDAAA